MSRNRRRFWRAFQSAKRVVLRPLLTGIMLGIGATMGRLIVRRYLMRRRPRLTPTVVQV